MKGGSAFSIYYCRVHLLLIGTDRHVSLRSLTAGSSPHDERTWGPMLSIHQEAAEFIAVRRAVIVSAGKAGGAGSFSEQNEILRRKTFLSFSRQCGLATLPASVGGKAPKPLPEGHWPSDSRFRWREPDRSRFYFILFPPGRAPCPRTSPAACSPCAPPRPGCPSRALPYNDNHTS